jgi:hypothetical protein
MRLRSRSWHRHLDKNHANYELAVHQKHLFPAPSFKKNIPKSRLEILEGWSPLGGPWIKGGGGFIQGTPISAKEMEDEPKDGRWLSSCTSLFDRQEVSDDQVQRNESVWEEGHTHRQDHGAFKTDGFSGIGARGGGEGTGLTFVL